MPTSSTTDSVHILLQRLELQLYLLQQYVSESEDDNQRKNRLMTGLGHAEAMASQALAALHDSP